MPAYIQTAPKLGSAKQLPTWSLFSILPSHPRMKMAIAEACGEFNKILIRFGYAQKLQMYDP